ncbi:hypothetical protein [Mesorhizobium sp.]|uniref:hypothetical protein n=1 Tax=Mesorhizobium sp. TaxID=1871066 RepID=UPI0025B8F359|nr:hypothetical protein [Mesorhizobium sp.]
MLQFRERVRLRHTLDVVPLDAGNGVVQRAFLLVYGLGSQRRRIFRKLLRQHGANAVIDARTLLGRLVAVLLERVFQNSNEICHASVDL